MAVVGRVRSPGPPTTEASTRIVSRLRALMAEFQALGVAPENAGAMGVASRFASERVRLDAGGRVQVDVSVVDTSDAALSALRQHDLDIEIVNVDLGIVEGWVPVAHLEALAAEPIVSKVRPPSYASRRTGSVTSQGDAIHRCNAARAGGITGAGVTVGVISDGVSGLAASQASGNLGAVSVLSPGSGDEGTAMLEIVHDCAPGAALAFSTGAPTSLAFISAVSGLRSAGARIIVDDLGFYGEPFFEDGPVAASDRVAGAAVLRVSAAGNDRKAHYRSPFVPSLFDPEVPGTRHDFGGGDTLMRFDVPGGTVATVILQWANRFGAAGDDYDLCVRDTGGTLVGCSVDVQDGNDDPIEALDLTCSAPAGSSCAGDVQVTLFSGVARTLELFCLRCQLAEFAVPAGSIVGHPGGPEVLAVAAAPASNPAIIEPFSSAGPAAIQFPAPASRPKPDLTGIDGVTTSRPGFAPFFGTSAAAPHVAAVAALVYQKNGTLTPAQARAILTASAVNLLGAGFDADSGFGRADAVNALAATALPIFLGGVFVAVGDLDGDGRAELITGPGAGRVAEVRAFDATGTQRLSYQVYDAGFQGGIRVAACDFDGDGRADILSVAGPGGGPHVRLLKFDAAGAFLGDLASFLAYDPGLRSGLFVGCGDLDGDGVPEIVLGVDAGGGPHVRTFRYTPGTPGNVTAFVDFFAYDPGFRGGIRVAAGNVDGSDRASVVTGAGPGGGPHVRVLRWSGTAFVEQAGFLVYDAGFRSGIHVAAGDVLGDARAEIVTGADAGGGPHLRVWTGSGADTGVSFFAYAPSFTGGVRVAAGPVAGVRSIVTGAGPGGGAHVGLFTGTGQPLGGGFLAY
jgi:subtilisin family serine protease